MISEEEHLYEVNRLSAIIGEKNEEIELLKYAFKKMRQERDHHERHARDLYEESGE